MKVKVISAFGSDWFERELFKFLSTLTADNIVSISHSRDNGTYTALIVYKD